LVDRVARIEAAEAVPEAQAELEGVPTKVRFALVDYAGDDELVLSARLALRRYPEMAARVIALYGAAEPFERVLRRYGPEAIPPIHYFVAHELTSLELRSWLREPPVPAGTGGGDAAAKRPVVRGWYAIAFIERSGHDFLGQFVTDGQGRVSWVQSERLATATKRLFTSGVTGLEAKWHRGDALAMEDFGWAAVDVLAPLAAFKLVRAGKAGGRTAKSGRLAPAGSGASRAGRGLAIAGTVAGLGYVALHPSVLNSVAADIATALGLPGWAVIGGVWFLLLLPAIGLLQVLGRRLLAPATRLLVMAARGVARMRARSA
jgi:hypothetical protein